MPAPPTPNSTPKPNPTHSHRRSYAGPPEPEPEPKPDSDGRDTRLADPDSWKKHLRLVPGGLVPLPDLANIRLTLTHHPDWSGLLAFDECRYSMAGTRRPPFIHFPSSITYPFYWSDHYSTLLLDWLQRHDLQVQSVNTVNQAAESVAREHSYHPIRDYLSALTWDRRPRVCTWLNDYLGVPHDIYSHGVGRVFLLAAVSRVMEPGCKYDYCLILEGPQGTRKSTALRTLTEPWFAESTYQLGSMNSILSMRGILLLELPELSALEKISVSIIKQAISCQTDRVRVPYGRHVIDLPRECVFAGTSNLDTYLHDETGGRRFLPVKTGLAAPINIPALSRDRDQLWAEAVTLYHASEVQCYLESDYLARQAEREQRARYQPDSWEGMIEEWLMRTCKIQISLETVLTDVISLSVKEQKRNDMMRAAACMRALGWERFRERAGDRKWLWRKKKASAAATLLNGFSGNGHRIGLSPEFYSDDSDDD